LRRLPLAASPGGNAAVAAKEGAYCSALAALLTMPRS